MKLLKRRFLLGVFVILIGITSLLNNFHITNIDIGDLFDIFWPVLLLFWGVNLLVSRNSTGEVLSASILIFLGIAFLGNNLDLFDFNLDWFWNVFWPVIIILIGINLLSGFRHGGKSNIACMGAIERKTTPWVLESGSYWAVMGGIELDMTLADIPNEETVLDLTAFWGGIDIIVPKDVHVVTEGTVILGGLELLDKSTGGVISSVKAEQLGLSSNKKIIKIYCRALMGGIEIKTKEKISV